MLLQLSLTALDLALEDLVNKISTYLEHKQFI